MTEFEHGALIAAGLIVALHDQPTVAGNVLEQMGLQNSDCSMMDEYDKINLRLIEDSEGIGLTGL